MSRPSAYENYVCKCNMSENVKWAKFGVQQELGYPHVGSSLTVGWASLGLFGCGTLESEAPF